MYCQNWICGGTVKSNINSGELNVQTPPTLKHHWYPTQQPFISPVAVDTESPVAEKAKGALFSETLVVRLDISVR